MFFQKNIQNLPIKEWPEGERPREKLLNNGPDSLGDAELLAIFIRTGLPGKTALRFSSRRVAKSWWFTSIY